MRMSDSFGIGKSCEINWFPVSHVLITILFVFCFVPLKAATGDIHSVENLSFEEKEQLATYAAAKLTMAYMIDLRCSGLTPPNREEFKHGEFKGYEQLKELIDGYEENKNKLFTSEQVEAILDSSWSNTLRQVYHPDRDTLKMIDFNLQHLSTPEKSKPNKQRRIAILEIKDLQHAIIQENLLNKINDLNEELENYKEHQKRDEMQRSSMYFMSFSSAYYPLFFIAACLIAFIPDLILLFMFFRKRKRLVDAEEKISKLKKEIEKGIGPYEKTAEELNKKIAKKESENASLLKDVARLKGQLGNNKSAAPEHKKSSETKSYSPPTNNDKTSEEHEQFTTEKSVDTELNVDKQKDTSEANPQSGTLHKEFTSSAEKSLTEKGWFVMPDNGPRFLHSQMSKVSSEEYIYVIEYKAESQEGTLKISNPTRQRALQSHVRYFEHVCNYKNNPFQDMRSVIEEKPGRVKRNGDYWEVTEPVDVRFQ